MDEHTAIYDITAALTDINFAAVKHHLGQLQLCPELHHNRDYNADLLCHRLHATQFEVLSPDPLTIRYTTMLTPVEATRGSIIASSKRSYYYDIYISAIYVIPENVPAKDPTAPAVLIEPIIFDAVDRTIVSQQPLQTPDHIPGVDPDDLAWLSYCAKHDWGTYTSTFA